MERQHAIIEYNEAEGCFVVQDLNSAHGTYVNDCRVQNAAHMSNTLDQIPVDKTWSPMESSRKMKPEVQ